jgi:CheY-like chemotaxis protein
MSTDKTLDEYLAEALAHLHDPDDRPATLLYELAGLNSRADLVTLQSWLLQEIEALKPEDPTDPHLTRLYEILHSRFVLKYTQEKSAERIGVSVRHFNRLQKEAIHTLARRLWEKAAKSDSLPEGNTSESAMEGLQASDWHAQTQRELASLRANAPAAVADVGKTLRDLFELQNALTSAHGIEFELGFVQPDLRSPIHPSLLRQILITAISQFAKLPQSSPITIFAGLENGNVRITLTGTIEEGYAVPILDPLPGIVAPESASLDFAREGNNASLSIRVPSAEEEITVLVVDDNQDMAHFYRRATTGTRYAVLHIARGSELPQALVSTEPDIIVLDVMLPDMDGWKLLMSIHQNPDTRSIPVVVSTVVREEELALSLGASRFLSKPVRPREFIQALDQAMLQASAEDSGVPESI